MHSLTFQAKMIWKLESAPKNVTSVSQLYSRSIIQYNIIFKGSRYCWSPLALVKLLVRRGQGHFFLRCRLWLPWRYSARTQFADGHLLVHGKACLCGL